MTDDERDEHNRKVTAGLLAEMGIDPLCDVPDEFKGFVKSAGKKRSHEEFLSLPDEYFEWLHRASQPTGIFSCVKKKGLMTIE